MFRRGKGKQNQDGGSVLMEAVLAFPVLVFLFGATLWCCDLMLARSRLTIADRQAVWWGGARFVGRSLSAIEKAELILESLDEVYFSGISSQGEGEDSSQNLDQDLGALRLTKSDYPWISVAASKLQLSYELPLWLQGILSIPRFFWHEDAGGGGVGVGGGGGDLYTVDSGMDGTSVTIRAESVYSKNKSSALLFARSEYGGSFRHPRNWSAADISGRPNALEFLNFNKNAVFESWDKYIVREIGIHKAWGESGGGDCLWLEFPQLGVNASASDPWPISMASPTEVKAYKRFASFESWSE